MTVTLAVAVDRMWLCIKLKLFTSIIPKVCHNIMS